MLFFDETGTLREGCLVNLKPCYGDRLIDLGRAATRAEVEAHGLGYYVRKGWTALEAAQRLGKCSVFTVVNPDRGVERDVTTLLNSRGRVRIDLVAQRGVGGGR